MSTISLHNWSLAQDRSAFEASCRRFETMGRKVTQYCFDAHVKHYGQYRSYTVRVGQVGRKNPLNTCFK